MAQIFGLDFGTTTTLIAYVQDDPLKVNVLLNRDDNLPHPSAVCYEGGGSVLVGRQAKEQLTKSETGVVGNVIRSFKPFLGQGTDIHVGGVARKPADVVGKLLSFVKKDALSRDLRRNFNRAVFTVPINMGGKARKELREAALQADLGAYQIVHEPLAALYGYFRRQPDFRRRIFELDRKIVLVFDWGGGTLDLTLCRFIGGNIVQIQNKGDDRVGGDRFDERIVNLVKKKHIQAHNLEEWPDEIPGAEAKLNARCEAAKIRLSDQQSQTVLVGSYLKSEGPEQTLDIDLTREEFEEETKDIIDRGLENIDLLLDSTGIKNESIALCLASGGVIQMPLIKAKLREKFDVARVPTVDESDRVIAEGAAWIAHDGIQLRLAKPFELLNADDNYATIIRDSVNLPTEGKVLKSNFSMYCTDPRDGFAKFQMLRPMWPGQLSNVEPRQTYSTLSIKVDPTAKPFRERLDFSVEIDENLIAKTQAKSSLVNDSDEAEIHDLEFGLGLNVEDGSNPNQTDEDSADDSQNSESTDDVLFTGNSRHVKGQISLRSNISLEESAWHLVPGEIVEKYCPHMLDSRNINKSPKQLDEKMYYKPCTLELPDQTICNRIAYDIIRNGCDVCSPDHALSREEARRNRDA